MSKINIFGVSKGEKFLYIKLPLKEIKSKALNRFFQKYWPDYLQEKMYIESEKACPLCNPKGKKPVKRLHKHDIAWNYMSDKNRTILIEGRHEVHLIFEGPKADEISEEFDKWFSFVK
jgi:hypothetical protein